jgi:hypothetical protein
MNDVILLLFDENIFLILLENIDDVFLELNVLFNFYLRYDVFTY